MNGDDEDTETSAEGKDFNSLIQDTRRMLSCSKGRSKGILFVNVPEASLPRFQLPMELERLRKRGENVEELMRRGCGPMEAKWITIPEVRESEPFTVESYAETSLSEDGVKEQMTEEMGKAEPSRWPEVEARRNIEAEGVRSPFDGE